MIRGILIALLGVAIVEQAIGAIKNIRRKTPFCFMPKTTIKGHFTT